MFGLPRTNRSLETWMVCVLMAFSNGTVVEWSGSFATSWGSLLSRSLAQRVFLMSTQNKVPCDQLPVYCKFTYGWSLFRGRRNSSTAGQWTLEHKSVTSLLPGENNGLVCVKSSFYQSSRHPDCWIPKFLDRQGEACLDSIFIVQTNTVFLTNICNIWLGFPYCTTLHWVN